MNKITDLIGELVIDLKRKHISFKGMIGIIDLVAIISLLIFMVTHDTPEYDPPPDYRGFVPNNVIVAVKT